MGMYEFSGEDYFLNHGHGVIVDCLANALDCIEYLEMMVMFLYHLLEI
jgi:hypothetical protein